MTLQKDQPRKPWYKRIIDLEARERPDKKGSNKWVIRAIVVVAVLLVAGMITWGVIAGVKFF